MPLSQVDKEALAKEYELWENEHLFGAGLNREKAAGEMRKIVEILGKGEY